MNVAIEPIATAPDVTRVRLQGRIDSYTVERIGEELGSLIRIGTCRLVLDLSQVEFVAGPGLQMLLKSIQAARRQQGDIKLFGLQPQVAQLLQLAGFQTVAKPLPDEASALAEFGYASPSAPEQMQTLMPGSGAEFERTLVPGASGADAFGPTLVPGADGSGFEKTMLEPSSGVTEELRRKLQQASGANDIGFEKTMLEAPGGVCADLRKKLQQAAQSPDIGFEKTMIQTPSGSTAQQAAAAKPADVTDETCATILQKFGEVEKTFSGLPSATLAPQTATDQPDLLQVRAPAVSSVRVVLPAAGADLRHISTMVGAVGGLHQIQGMKLARFGVAVVETARAILRLIAPPAGLLCTISSEHGVLTVTFEYLSTGRDLFSSLRPESDSGIATPDAARNWLSSLAKVEVSDGDGRSRVVLTRS